jgi:hypothetical protein
MKKIIDLIKSLLGGGSLAEKAAEITQLEVAVKEEVTADIAKVEEVKAKIKKEIAEVEAKVKKATSKATPKKSAKKKD